MNKHLFATLLFLLALPAAATIVPADARPFETVSLRMTVDSCAYDAQSTRVDSMQGNVIVIASPLRNCLVAGPPQVVDIRLGQFPPGDYIVQVHLNPTNSEPPYVRETFAVRAGPEIAVFPPPTRPLADYNGLWWDPTEPGWGVSIHQGPTGNIFAMLFVYNSQSQPEWYTLQGGKWTSPTTWIGRIYRTTSQYAPTLSTGPATPAEVVYQDLGGVTLDFTQKPGQVDSAHLSYIVGYDAYTDRRIVRMRM